MERIARTATLLFDEAQTAPAGAGARLVRRELVERAQGGDRVAFTELAAASVGKLFNIAQLMLRDHHLAEDAVQEALVVAWRDIRGLRDPDAFDAWLHRVLVRCVYREADRERRRTVRTLASDETRDQPDAADAIADRDAIDRAFRRLLPDQRAVLVLRHYLGMSDRDAGAALGV